MALHPEILDRPAGEGARVVALALLAEARERAGRLGTPGDDEALHDFRVAVRRARSTLRAWRDVLGPAVRDKDLRRLRKVARATGAARDAEVLLAWVEKAARDLPPAHRPAVAWLRERLAARTVAGELSAAVERLVDVADRLERRLSREPPDPGGPTLDLALAGRIREHAAAVEELLSRVESPADAPVAHRARIAGKRLRYLVEPLRETPGVESREAVRALKEFQDLLGDLHDAVTAVEALREARRDAGAAGARGAVTGPGPRPGLVALEAIASDRADLLFARLREEVLVDRGAAALAPSLALAAALETRRPVRP